MNWYTDHVITILLYHGQLEETNQFQGYYVKNCTRRRVLGVIFLKNWNAHLWKRHKCAATQTS